MLEGSKIWIGIVDSTVVILAAQVTNLKFDIANGKFGGELGIPFQKGDFDMVVSLSRPVFGSQFEYKPVTWVRAKAR